MALQQNMDLFGGGGGEAPSPRKKMKAAEIIKLIEKNDPSLTVADFAGSTIYALKAVPLTEQLCAALKASTHVKEVNLEDCGVNDACCVMLGEMLSTNTSIKKCVLNKNKIKDEGCTALANGLATNTTLREIEVFGQEGGRKWGEGCLVQWLEMYKTNVTIIRVNWCALQFTQHSGFRVAVASLSHARVRSHPRATGHRSTNSKSTVTLTKMLARNTDINRALKNGDDYVKLLPTPLQADPPKLEFYQIEDVRAKRGGVAEVRNHQSFYLASS
jgi:hypothetical protein